MSEAHELTSEEIRSRFLNHIWTMVDYWDKEPRVIDTREKLSGLAFSILAMLDGSNANIPAFRICPDPHPDDEQYLKEHGKDWYPSNTDVELRGEITDTMLHEVFYQHDLRRKPLT